MSLEFLVSSADICQSATLLASLAAYIPQWQLLKSSGSSKNISLKSWVLWSLSAGLSWFYAFVQFYAYGTGLALLLTSTLVLALIAYTIHLILKSRGSEAGLFETAARESIERHGFSIEIEVPIYRGSIPAAPVQTEMQ